MGKGWSEGISTAERSIFLTPVEDANRTALSLWGTSMEVSQWVTKVNAYSSRRIPTGTQPEDAYAPINLIGPPYFWRYVLAEATDQRRRQSD